MTVLADRSQSTGLRLEDWNYREVYLRFMRGDMIASGYVPSDVYIDVSSSLGLDRPSWLDVAKERRIDAGGRSAGKSDMAMQQFLPTGCSCISTQGRSTSSR